MTKPLTFDDLTRDELLELLKNGGGWSVGLRDILRARWQVASRASDQKFQAFLRVSGEYSKRFQESLGAPPSKRERLEEQAFRLRIAERKAKRAADAAERKADRLYKELMATYAEQSA